MVTFKLKAVIENLILFENSAIHFLIWVRLHSMLHIFNLRLL